MGAIEASNFILMSCVLGKRRLRQQDNRAFDVLKRKFFCQGGRANVGDGYDGWGLKVFPLPESERPR